MVDSQQSTSSVLPSVERIQQELARAKSIDDLFGKEGIFARLFANTLEQMLDAELTAHLGYPRHAPEGHHSGNSRNGKRTRQLRTSTGDTTIQVPRDRSSTFQSPLLDAYQTNLITFLVYVAEEPLCYAPVGCHEQPASGVSPLIGQHCQSR
jgi:transposase-like protein